MEELKQAMKVVLANSFAFYLKAQFYHWNVRGANFPQYHQFLGTLYEEVQSAVDVIAEQIRALDELAPGSFSRFSQLTTIEDAVSSPPSQIMFQTLLSDNQRVVDSLTNAYNLAEKYKQIGTSNFLQSRIDVHKKHHWMIKSTGAKE